MIINHKKTKIIATLGPASDDKEMMLEMVKAGANVFRINMSHADREIASLRARRVAEINAENGTNVAVLADLQGPKLRVGEIAEGTVVQPGDIVTFTNTPGIGDRTKAYMTYDCFASDTNPGEIFLVDDGKLMFEVLETNKKDEVKAKVIQGGPFRSRKGVNLPNTKVSLPALTEKDIRDVQIACEIEADWIALSFVRSAEDVKLLRETIKQFTDRRIPIISKIEKPEAVADIENILLASDAVMVARGDLGIEIPAEAVPLIQKDLVKKARKFSKPIIIATQMMESMMESMTPSRSDVNDVANSVIDGADAVMLSGETAAGKYPVQVIRQMTRIIKSVESYRLGRLPKYPPVDDGKKRILTSSLCYYASEIALEMHAKAITTITRSGYTAYKISSHRPDAHILVFTNSRYIMRQLNLVWGCRAFFYEPKEHAGKVVLELNRMAKERGFVNHDDKVVNLIAMPIDGNGQVNTMRISTVDKVIE